MTTRKSFCYEGIVDIGLTDDRVRQAIDDQERYVYVDHDGEIYRCRIGITELIIDCHFGVEKLEKLSAEQRAERKTKLRIVGGKQNE